MASPLKSGKQSVNLASSGVRVSRIRRDPPPVVKEKVVNVKERDRWDVAVGILAFTLAIVVIIFAFTSYSGWSPGQYTIRVELS